MPKITLEEYRLMSMFQEAWDEAHYHLWQSAFWSTYHEFTMK